MEQDSIRESGGARPVEMLAFSVGTLTLMTFEVLVSDPKILFDRYLWIDELWTKFIESKPTVLESMIALMHSGDPTPPVYHLVARLFWELIGGPPEIAFRLLSFLSIWLALVLMYAVLRRTFEILPAITALLAFWSSSPIVKYAFYARPYGPLLASVAGFCFFYCNDDDSWIATAFSAVTAILVCTMHYFGVFALGSVVLGDTIARREPPREVIRRLLPVAAGPLALLACLPFVRAWSAGQTAYNSFLGPLTLAHALLSIAAVLVGAVAISTAIIICAWSISAVTRQLRTRFGRQISPPVRMVRSMRPVCGMMALMLVPVSLAVFSALVQPVLLTRYMIPGLLGVIPVLALIASSTSPRILFPATILIAIVGAFQVRHFGETQATWQQREERMLRVGSEDELPIVTFSVHEAYAFYEYAPKLRARIFIADFRTSDYSRLSKLVAQDLELATKWSTVDPDLPKLVDRERLSEMGKFHLIYPEVSVLRIQEQQPGKTYSLESIAQLFSLQNKGDDIYEVRAK